MIARRPYTKFQRLVLTIAGLFATISTSVLLANVVLPILWFYYALNRMQPQEFTPPLQYYGWWDDVQQCALHPPDEPEFPRFFYVPVEAYIEIPRWPVHYILGLYDPFRHRIYLAMPRVDDSETVRHEMLHALGAGHDSPDFPACGLVPE